MIENRSKLTIWHSKTDQEGEGQVTGAPSGKVLRPGARLNACLAPLVRRDTREIWKLDRLGRSLRHLVNTLSELTARGFGLKVLPGKGSMIDTTKASGRLMSGIFADLAEFERELIVERTRASVAAAQARGKHCGRRFEMTPKKIRLLEKAMGKREKFVVDFHRHRHLKGDCISLCRA